MSDKTLARRVIRDAMRKLTVELARLPTDRALSRLRDSVQAQSMLAWEALTLAWGLLRADSEPNGISLGYDEKSLEKIALAYVR